MKVGKRTVPTDSLCFDHGEYKVRVFTHHQQITFTVEKAGKVVHQQWTTPEQFISLLMRDAQP